MTNSKVRNLCKTSPLDIIQSAYKEVFLQQENPSDLFIVEEIEWKLNNAINDLQYGFPFFTEKEIEDTKLFLEQLKAVMDD